MKISAFHFAFSSISNFHLLFSFVQHVLSSVFILIFSGPKNICRILLVLLNKFIPSLIFLSLLLPSNRMNCFEHTKVYTTLQWKCTKTAPNRTYDVGDDNISKLFIFNIFFSFISKSTFNIFAFYIFLNNFFTINIGAFDICTPRFWPCQSQYVLRSFMYFW